MDLKWTKYTDQTPIDGSKCIVAHFNANGKVISGIYKFHSAGNQSYWQKGSTILNCKSNDCWCQVDSIINSLAQRLIDETVEEKHRLHSLYNH